MDFFICIHTYPGVCDSNKYVHNGSWLWEGYGCVHLYVQYIHPYILDVSYVCMGVTIQTTKQICCTYVRTWMISLIEFTLVSALIPVTTATCLYV